jgi:hypothetical protein
VQDPHRGRARVGGDEPSAGIDDEYVHPTTSTTTTAAAAGIEEGRIPRLSGQEVLELERGYVDMERSAHLETTTDSLDLEAAAAPPPPTTDRRGAGVLSQKQRDERAGRVVDVVLSDMCEPWELTTGFWLRSVAEPYRRMMNTSGIPFKDHAGSMVSFSVFFRVLHTHANGKRERTKHFPSQFFPRICAWLL